MCGSPPAGLPCVTRTFALGLHSLLEKRLLVLIVQAEAWLALLECSPGAGAPSTPTAPFPQGQGASQPWEKMRPCQAVPGSWKTDLLSTSRAPGKVLAQGRGGDQVCAGGPPRVFLIPDMF